MNWYITTTDENRSNKWRAIFGLDRLPVMAGKARFQEMAGSFRPVPCYDLDPSRLSGEQVQSFVEYIVERAKIPPQEARGMLHNWPIKAGLCTAVSDPPAVAKSNQF